MHGLGQIKASAFHLSCSGVDDNDDQLWCCPRQKALFFFCRRKWALFGSLSASCFRVAWSPCLAVVLVSRSPVCLWWNTWCSAVGWLVPFVPSMMGAVHDWTHPAAGKRKAASNAHDYGYGMTVQGRQKLAGCSQSHGSSRAGLSLRTKHCNPLDDGLGLGLGLVGGKRRAVRHRCWTKPQTRSANPWSQPTNMEHFTKWAGGRCSNSRRANARQGFAQSDTLNSSPRRRCCPMP